MDGNVVWFKSEMEDFEKWKTQNIKQTLPEEVKAKIDEAERVDKEEQNDLDVPNEDTIRKLTDIIGEEDAKEFLKLA